jgi:soluble lytic murein transglycosylase-like protein
MRKRLQLVLMASTVIATFLSLAPYVQAEPGDSRNAVGTIATTTENGRKVYVNEASPLPPRHSQATSVSGAVAPRRPLVYWSAAQRRWKPVPPANGATMRAARSAAAEVNQYIGHEPNPEGSGSATNFVRGQGFNPQDVDAAIVQAAARHNVDPNLVRSVIKVESNFNPNAVSRKGAMGLMQLMPSTARQLNVSNPFDPQQNVDAGVRHLKQLLENYGGDVKLSLAAYNAGAGAVARSAGVPRFAETQNYVRRITNLYYGGTVPGSYILGNPVHDPVRVHRDARGVLYISNTD